MKTSLSALSLLVALQLPTTVQAQELSPRLGLDVFAAQPNDTAGNLYASGWKLSLTIHVRREAEVEGRVRMEFGRFGEGSGTTNGNYSRTKTRAQTRMVSYDWLIPLGQKAETGFDLILGIGGAHWITHSQVETLPGNPYPYSYTYDDDNLAFAATLGLRYRLGRHWTLEVHHVFSTTPGHQKDFEDAELSHTALGLGYRF